MNNYREMSLAELRKAAKELGISGYSSKKKDELIEMLTASGKKEEAAEKPLTEEPVKASTRKEETSPKAVVKASTKKPEKPITEESVKPERKVTKEAASMPSERKEAPEAAVTERPRVIHASVNGGQQARREVPRREEPGRETQKPGAYDAVRQETGRRPADSARVNDNASRYGEARQGETRQSENRQSVQRQPEQRPVEQRQTELRQAERQSENQALDSGIVKTGILEIAAEQSFGFIRDENYLPSSDDVYVSPAIIKRYNLTTGDIVTGHLKVKAPNEKFVALLNVTRVNGENPERSAYRKRFEKLTPVFPHERLRLETVGGPTSVRIVDLLSPIGKGQRGMIVSPPKAGKTTLLKDIARAVQKNNPNLHMIILLIDERPEEVTDMKDSIKGDNVEIIYSTFDEAPEKHKRVSEMTVEHAKRLVEYGKDVIILLDSITRLARAYNLTCQSSGRTLSGGLDPAALYMPKRFFGAARCMKEGGSLTILATALVDTGSRMDDVVFEEFKGTGNMELTLNRALSERRIFPAIDLPKSSTRREDLLLSPVEQEANLIMRRAFGGTRAEEATEQIVSMFMHTRSNAEFITQLKRTRLFG